MTYYVYIIRSLKTDQFYIGQTNDLDNRVQRHNAGYEKATKNRGPWVLFAYLKTGSRAQALRTEKKIKNFKSRKRTMAFAKEKMVITQREV